MPYRPPSASPLTITSSNAAIRSGDLDRGIAAIRQLRVGVDQLYSGILETIMVGCGVDERAERCIDDGYGFQRRAHLERIGVAGFGQALGVDRYRCMGLQERLDASRHVRGDGVLVLVDESLHVRRQLALRVDNEMRVADAVGVVP